MKFRQYSPDHDGPGWGLEEWDVATLGEFFATALAKAFSNQKGFRTFRLAGMEIWADFELPFQSVLIAKVLSDPLPQWVEGTTQPPPVPRMLFAHVRLVLGNVSEMIAYGGPGPTGQDVLEAISNLGTLERLHREQHI